MSKANDNVGRVRRSWGSGNDYGSGDDTNGRDMDADLLGGVPVTSLATDAEVTALLDPINTELLRLEADKVTGSWSYDSTSNILTISTT